jgi:hypothetical protein
MGKPKKYGPDMGVYVPTEDELKAYKWGIRNNISIAPFALSEIKWYIDITIKGKTARAPDIYPKILIFKKIYEYYKYYYDKKGNT